MGNNRDELIREKENYYINLINDSISRINSYLMPSYNLNSYSYYNLENTYISIENFISEYKKTKEYFELVDNCIDCIKLYLNFIKYIEDFLFVDSFYIEYELNKMKRELTEMMAKEKID